jgi:CHAD domain-containing protein
MNTPPLFREYGAKIIRENLEKMLSRTDAVYAAEEMAALKAMRVASRRLRAATDVFSGAFRDPTFGSFEREVKAVTDVLGAARDLDVMIDTLGQLQDSLPEEERGGLTGFIEQKVQERERMQKKVRRTLEKMERRSLAGTFEAVLIRSLPLPDICEPAPDKQIILPGVGDTLEIDED